MTPSDTTEATARPWEVVNQTDIFEAIRSGKQIGDTWMRAAGYGYVMPLEESRANAVLIVRSVNNAGKLADALDKLIRHVAMSGGLVWDTMPEGTEEALATWRK